MRNFLLLLLASGLLFQTNAQDLAMHSTQETPHQYTGTLSKGDKNGYPVFHLSATAGYAYRTAKVSDQQPLLIDYIKKLKSGFGLEMDGHFLINGTLGLGLSYNWFRSSNTLPNIITTFEDGTSYLGMKDDISSHFIGPSLMSRMPSANGLHCLNLVVGVGYLNYNDDRQLENLFLNYKGETVGFMANLNYDIGLSEQLKINLKFSYITGVLNQMDFNDGVMTRTIDLKQEFGEGESLDRINITVGLSLLL